MKYMKALFLSFFLILFSCSKNSANDTDLNNGKVLQKVAEKSYLPTNAVLGELLARHPEFKFAFSFW